jgi:hypothetical protein
MDPLPDLLEEILFGRRIQKRPPTAVGSLFAILSISIQSVFVMSRKKSDVYCLRGDSFLPQYWGPPEKM